MDDHPIVRRGLVDTISDEPDLMVCGEAGTVREALDVVAAERPNVAIIDLSLGPESGLDLVAAVARSHPLVRMLVLSSYDERLYADRALKAGALGYVMKDRAASELLVAVRRVAAAKPYVSTEAAERILSTLGGSRRVGEASPFERLSDRERHVLALIGKGLATREIAAQLRLSIKTIETHYAHIKEKLGLRNARELTRAAVTWADAQQSRSS